MLLVTVPGALEIPLALQKMALTDQFDALIALGAVIRGETYHFEIVSNHLPAVWPLFSSIRASPSPTVFSPRKRRTRHWRA